MSYPLTIISLEKTCIACPSQWEGHAMTGEEIYVRYRWGTLRLDVNNETVYHERLGDALDGDLEEEVMLDSLKEFIRLPEGGLE